MNYGIDSIKRKAGISEDQVFGIAPEPRESREEIERIRQALIAYADSVLDSAGSPDGEYHHSMLCKAIDDLVDGDGVKMAEIRDWGERWKRLALDMYAAINELHGDKVRIFIDSRVLEDIDY